MLVSSTDMNIPTTSTASGSNHDPAPTPLCPGTVDVGRGGVVAFVGCRADGAGAGRTGIAALGRSGAGRRTGLAGRTTSTCWGTEAHVLPADDLLDTGRTSPSGELIPTSKGS
jgi:hypothetical protein